MHCTTFYHPFPFLNAYYCLILARMQEKRKPYLYLDDFDPRWFHNYNYNIIPRVANTVSIRQTEKVILSSFDFL